MDSRLKATVFIPVYNGEKDHLEETLEALYQQETKFEWDVLITDSGSSDRSVQIIESFADKYGNLSLKKIDKRDYSHGRTRQWAAEVSKGEFMVYLTQDAVPYNKDWLTEMIAPFELSSKVVAVVGRQKPRLTCFPAMKYDIEAVFDEQGSRDAITLWTRKEPLFVGKYTKESFYSDVCSAAPRKFLLEEIPYRSVPYSEDYEFGKDVVDAGYIKAYNGKAVVEHSNDVRLSEYRKRIFDENYYIRLNSGTTNNVSIFSVALNSMKGFLKDTPKILVDRDFSWKRKCYWLCVNPLFHIERWRGIRLANKVDFDVDVSQLSLEKSRDRK